MNNQEKERQGFPNTGNKYAFSQLLLHLSKSSLRFCSETLHLSVIIMCIFFKHYTVLKGHIMCCVCFTCMQDCLLPLRPLCLVKLFNHKIIFKNSIKSNSQKSGCSISNTLHYFNDDGTKKDKGVREVKQSQPSRQ